MQYYVMMSIKEGDSHDISELVRNLMNYVNSSDLVVENTEDLAAFFNVTTAKRLFEYCEEHSDIPDLECKIVGAESSSDLSNMIFLDEIELFPFKDDRFDETTGEFEAIDLTNDTLHSSSPISLTRTQSQTQEKSEPTITHKALEPSFKATDLDIDQDSEDEIFESLLPTYDSIEEATSNHLSIDTDESDMTEVIISQSEASLAMMHTLMSDELENAQKLDIDRINRIIRPSIRTLESAKEYAKSKILYENFMSEVREQSQFIAEEYENTLRAYLDKKIKELEEEYRASVPDDTNEKLSKYYAGVDADFKYLSKDVKNKRYIAEQTVLEIFLKEDTSPAAKAIRKYVSLKRQISDSTRASIERINQSAKQKEVVHEEPVYDEFHDNEFYDDGFHDDYSQPQQFQHDYEADDIQRQLDEIRALRDENESEKAELSKLKQSLEQLKNEEAAKIEMRAKELEERESKLNLSQEQLDKALALNEELQSKVNELERSKQHLLSQISDTSSQPSDSKPDESASDTSDHHHSETQESAKTETESEPETNAKSEEPTKLEVPNNDSDKSHDKSSSQTENASMHSTDDDAMSLDELISLDDNDALAEEFGLNDDDDSPKKKSFKLSKKHKIIIGVVAALSVIGLTFGVSSMLKHGSSNNSAQTTKSAKTSKSTSKSSSKKVTDTIFKVGDVLNVTDDQGNAVDVQIKEFKEDGSAVGEDSNKGKWLITREQIEQYAKTNSKTTTSSSTQKSAKQETIIASRVETDETSTQQSSDATAEDETQTESEDLSVDYN